MTPEQLELWNAKRAELFPTRLAPATRMIIDAKVLPLDYAAALVALNKYRKEPYRGFYVDRFLSHYSIGTAAKAAPRCVEPDGIDPEAKSRELERFSKLPPEFVRECVGKYGDYGYPVGGVCFAIICNDAYMGRDVERYRQHQHPFSDHAQAEARRRAALAYGDGLRAATEVERLRIELQAAKRRISELMGGIDVSA